MRTLPRVSLSPLFRALAGGCVHRFAAASAASTLVTLAALGVLLEATPLAAWTANLTASVTGAVLGYELNRRWVWGGTAHARRWLDLGAFCALSLAGLGVSTGAVDVAARSLAGAGASATLRTGVLQVTDLACFAILVGFRFLLSRGLFADQTGGAHRLEGV